MRRHFIATSLITLFGLSLPGCKSYQARPLLPQEVVAGVERARHFMGEQDRGAESGTAAHARPPIFSFTQATELMARNSPAIRQAQAEYDTALALAKVKTPLPNPAIEAGPKFGFGPDVMRRAVEPFGSIGFSIPTGKRLKRQDELNRMSAEMALVEAIAKHRELYLDLRRLYSRLALGRARIASRKGIVESAAKSVSLTKRLGEAGQTTALDLSLLEVEYARIQTDSISSEKELLFIEGELSELIGVHSDYFQTLPDPALPEMPGQILSIKELQEILVKNHPELARLRASYEVSERQLRLEIAKQFPDFHIGPSAEGDINDRKTILGLTLGIDIPAFDRNQQNIATSLKRRDEIRVKYEAAANKALATLDRAWRSYNLSIEKLKLLKIVSEKASASVELARKSLEAGATDALRFLETERAQRAILIDAIDTELAVREAWIETEQAVGFPLLAFPGERAEALPPLPDMPSGSQSLPSEEKQPK